MSNVSYRKEDLIDLIDIIQHLINYYQYLHIVNVTCNITDPFKQNMLIINIVSQKRTILTISIIKSGISIMKSGYNYSYAVDYITTMNKQGTLIIDEDDVTNLITLLEDKFNTNLLMELP